MISVIIPAHNEENYLGVCLSTLLASRPVTAKNRQVPVEIIVAANACTDRTVEIARAYEPAARLRGWFLEVLDLKQGGKTYALNEADMRATGDIRVYVDADIVVGPALLDLTWAGLRGEAPAYASGHGQIAQAATFATRAYREIYMRIPFRTKTIPGGGYFSVNSAGRARWNRFPDIIADDLFVRLNFAPEERVLINEVFRWELTEGFRALIRVRRRQDRGTRELLACFPDLLRNEDKPGFEPGEFWGLATRFPFGMIVYCAVSVLARIPVGMKTWARGRL